MTGEFLLCLGSILTFVWGVAHRFPARAAVAGFRQISADNRYRFTMEWLGEKVLP
jgi:hypothetical protein